MRNGRIFLHHTAGTFGNHPTIRDSVPGDPQPTSPGTARRGSKGGIPCGTPGTSMYRVCSHQFLDQYDRPGHGYGENKFMVKNEATLESLADRGRRMILSSSAMYDMPQPRALNTGVHDENSLHVMPFPITYDGPLRVQPPESANCTSPTYLDPERPGRRRRTVSA
mgnify:CR=1 FL=1